MSHSSFETIPLNGSCKVNPDITWKNKAFRRDRIISYIAFSVITAFSLSFGPIIGYSLILNKVNKKTLCIVSAITLAASLFFALILFRYRKKIMPLTFVPNFNNPQSLAQIREIFEKQNLTTLSQWITNNNDTFSALQNYHIIKPEIALEIQRMCNVMAALIKNSSLQQTLKEEIVKQEEEIWKKFQKNNMRFIISLQESV